MIQTLNPTTASVRNVKIDSHSRKKRRLYEEISTRRARHVLNAKYFCGYSLQVAGLNRGQAFRDHKEILIVASEDLEAAKG